MADTATLIIDATYRLHPDDVDAFKALASRMAAMAKQRDGCAFLKAAQDTADPNTVRLFEGWRDQAALEAHLASDEFKDVMQQAGKLRVTDRSANRYTVSDSKPLDMPS